MTRLSGTQLVILSAAAQRDDLSVLPLPDSLTLKGGALNKVMDSLRKRGLIRVLGGDGGPERVVLTSEGMAAIGVGNVFGSFLEGALRNPGAADGQQGRLFIGFAAAELLGLLSFVVAMILIFVA